jgi:S-methylmethionine-dependent homocysteine/selenocysteine methylase
MPKYRNALPQLGESLFLTDGGIETTLIFQEHLDLPDFAAFDLLKTHEGEEALLKYFRTYAALANHFETGLILESPTWRASADWGTRLGYNRTELADANLKAISLLEEIRAEYEGDENAFVISGCVGPRGDGYVPDSAMSARQAEEFHLDQISTFAASAADMICAITMNYVEEGLGIARAARNMAMPVALSFTVETDGRLPTGDSLQVAVDQIDDATAGYPAYYMVNCAHPTHFDHVLSGDGAWLGRIRGIRANASRQSHAELNESPVLDSGDPVEFGNEYAELKKRVPGLTVFGGCCGTDHRHIESIADSCLPLFRSE